MLCHRSSLLLAGDQGTSFLTSTLILCSFSVNILTMLTLSAYLRDKPEMLYRIPAWPFMLSAAVGVCFYSLAAVLGAGGGELPYILVGSMLTGLGFGFLWGSWADAYGRMHPTRNALLMVMVFICTILVFFAVSGCVELTRVPAVLPMVLLPPISWLCLLACRREQAAEQAAAEQAAAEQAAAVGVPGEQAAAVGVPGEHVQSEAHEQPAPAGRSVADGMPAVAGHPETDGQPLVRLRRPLGMFGRQPTAGAVPLRVQKPTVSSIYKHHSSDYLRALRSLWQLLLGAAILSFLFGFVWQLTVLFTGSVNDAHRLPLVGNLIIGVVLLVFVLITNRQVNLEIIYRFIGPTIVCLCLLIPWLITASPVTFNIVMSTGYGVFDVVIWYMVAQTSFDHRVSGFIIGSIVRSLALVARLVGIVVASLFATMPEGTHLLLLALFSGSCYLLLVWLMAYRRYRRRQAFKQTGLDAGAAELEDEWVLDISAGQPDALFDSGSAAASAADRPAEPKSQDMLNQLFGQKAARIAANYGLTQREAEILPYLLRGRSAAYIAAALFVSENTVRSHIRRILEKTNTHSKQSLIDLTDDGGV